MTENETKVFELVQDISRFACAAAEKTRKARFEGKSTWDNMKEQAEAGGGCILELEKYRAIGKAREIERGITEIVNQQLIAGKDDCKEVYSCFYDIAKAILNIGDVLKGVEE